MARKPKQNWGNDVYAVWASGSAESGRNRSGGNVYFHKEIIFSFGSHFPMGVRQANGDFVLNGDTYSNTTNRHQSRVRAAAHKAVLRQRYGKVMVIPFSALRGPGNTTPHNLDIVNVESDRNVITPCTRAHPKRQEVYGTGNWRKREYKTLPAHTAEERGEKHTHSLHLMGRAVFKVTAYGKDKTAMFSRYFISGLDETARNVWRSHFISELPTLACTVAQAIESLKPPAVRDYQQKDTLGAQPAVLRQGEWFFIPRPGVDTHTLKPLLGERRVNRLGETYTVKDRLLPVGPGANGRRSHRVTELRHGPDGLLYARGTVIHTGGEHKRLTLGKVWHTAHMNTAKGSWSGAGRVD